MVRSGVNRDEISIVGRTAEGKTGLLADDDRIRAGEGAALGGIAGLVATVAALMIPGIGAIVAIGPIGAALTAAITGAVGGGIAGALMDAGVGREEAGYYEERFKEGGVLLTVRTDDGRYDNARAILQRHGGDVRGAGAEGTMDTGRTTGTTPRVSDEPGTVDTSRTTRTGTTDYPGTVDPTRSTTPSPDIRRPGEPPDTGRPGGPPVI